MLKSAYKLRLLTSTTAPRYAFEAIVVVVVAEIVEGEKRRARAIPNVPLLFPDELRKPIITYPHNLDEIFHELSYGEHTCKSFDVID
jgi:hypothetical protein